MKNRLFLLSFALLVLTGCATNSLPNLSKPPTEAPTCPVAAFQACEAPMLSTDKSLAATELVDVENRARWLGCIERHNAWLACASTLIEQGYLRGPAP